MKKIILPMILMFTLVSFAGIEDLRAEEKKMAGSAGLGITYPMGDTGDVVDFPMIPLLLSYQYAIQPFLTLEADVYYYLYTSPAEDYINDFSIYQLGVSVRYWLTKEWKQGDVYEGIYVGGGLARTTAEVEVEYREPTDYDPLTGEITYRKVTATDDETDTTLVLKGGYIYPLEPVLLDIGARYDAVDFEFGDALFTVYCMASYLF